MSAATSLPTPRPLFCPHDVLHKRVDIDIAGDFYLVHFSTGQNPVPECLHEFERNRALSHYNSRGKYLQLRYGKKHYQDLQLRYSKNHFAAPKAVSHSNSPGGSYSRDSAQTTLTTPYYSTTLRRNQYKYIIQPPPRCHLYLGHGGVDAVCRKSLDISTGLSPDRRPLQEGRKITQSYMYARTLDCCERSRGSMPTITTPSGEYVCGPHTKRFATQPLCMARRHNRVRVKIDSPRRSSWTYPRLLKVQHIALPGISDRHS